MLLAKGEKNTPQKWKEQNVNSVEKKNKKKHIQVNILNPGIRKYKVIVAIATTNQLFYTQLLQY